MVTEEQLFEQVDNWNPETDSVDELHKAVLKLLSKKNEDDEYHKLVELFGLNREFGFAKCQCSRIHHVIDDLVEEDGVFEILACDATGRCLTISWTNEHVVPIQQDFELIGVESLDEIEEIIAERKREEEQQI